jgi:DNA polymerase-3 subunit epsilon
MEEFLRAGIPFDIENRYFVDVQNIFHQMEQRTLKAAYLFYCNKEIINAHSAEADTRATMEVLLAQIEKYKDADFVDKKGNSIKPIVNDIEALHHFTNLNKPVDFAGRMVFNEQGEELFNFGKHKGKKVEDVFTVEPSYYAWMMQGDFPLYTKRKLEEIYSRWTAKRAAERRERPVQQKSEQEKPAQHLEKPVVTTKPAENQPKKEFRKPDNRNNAHYNRPPKKDEPARPVDDDMLKMLTDKFKKG